MGDVKPITLYLTPWQKRMIKDHMKDVRLTTLNKIHFSVIDKIHWVTYRVPTFEAVKEGAWNLYLTDEQIAEVVECTGLKTKISALTITPGMVADKTIIFG